MYTSPFLLSQIAREREREMHAQASQQRQAREAQALTGAAQPGLRRPRRTLRALLRPHTHAPA
jgi:hypothetical protein